MTKGHVVPTNSPWNTPIFIIKKSHSNEWRLLQVLIKINEIIEEMGPLQLGLPSPITIPTDWALMIIDLKDWFFSIPYTQVMAPSLPSPYPQSTINHL